MINPVAISTRGHTEKLGQVNMKVKLASAYLVREQLYGSTAVFTMK